MVVADESKFDLKALEVWPSFLESDVALEHSFLIQDYEAASILHQDQVVVEVSYETVKVFASYWQDVNEARVSQWLNH